MLLKKKVTVQLLWPQLVQYMSVLRASLANRQGTPPVASSQYRSLDQLTVYVITINNLMSLRRIRWAGHVARMGRGEGGV